jgi:hypothetical protein
MNPTWSRLSLASSSGPASESYEEARAALLEEGVDINRIPMLTDMRPPEGQERS